MGLYYRFYLFYYIEIHDNAIYLLSFNVRLKKRCARLGWIENNDFITREEDDNSIYSDIDLDLYIFILI
jgi:hypothetical protein